MLPDVNPVLALANFYYLGKLSLAFGNLVPTNLTPASLTKTLPVPLYTQFMSSLAGMTLLY